MEYNRQEEKKKEEILEPKKRYSEMNVTYNSFKNKIEDDSTYNKANINGKNPDPSKIARRRSNDVIRVINALKLAI